MCNDKKLSIYHHCLKPLPEGAGGAALAPPHITILSYQTTISFRIFVVHPYARNAGDAYQMINQLKSLSVEPQAIEQSLNMSIPENKIMLAVYLATPEIEGGNAACTISLNGIPKAARSVFAGWGLCRAAPPDLRDREQCCLSFFRLFSGLQQSLYVVPKKIDPRPDFVRL